MRRQWFVIVIVALLGAAGGAYLGDRVAPDVVGVLASLLAVVGFGLGALVGVILQGWWRPPPKPPDGAVAISDDGVHRSRAGRTDARRGGLTPSTPPRWSSTRRRLRPRTAVNRAGTPTTKECAATGMVSAGRRSSGASGKPAHANADPRR